MIELSTKTIERAGHTLTTYVAADTAYPGLSCEAIDEQIAVRGLSQMIIEHQWMVDNIEEINRECNNYF